MALEYPAEWKFEGVDFEIPTQAHAEFADLISKIASGYQRPQTVFEDFKSAYGMHGGSSDAGWAENDLRGAMASMRKNAAEYIASFWAGCEAVQARRVSVPSVKVVNLILEKWNVPFVVDPPVLRRKGGDITVAETVSEDEDASTPIYRRGKEVGFGGFGRVYKVTRVTSAGEFDFAMKVFEPSSFIKDKARARSRFSREMRILSRMQHRGIVPHLEAGFDEDERPYILMPLVDGKDLRDALSGAQPEKVVGIFIELLKALEYSHSKNVIHRDLKPKNVIVRSSDDQPIILDFGCAYCFDDFNEESLTTTLVGSRAYIPSEVIRDPKRRSVKQDVYACGVMLYEVLGECLPDPENYSPIANMRDDCDGVDEVIESALAHESKRLESAVEFQRRLNLLLSSWSD